MKLPKILCIDEIHIKSNVKYPYASVLPGFNENKIVVLLITRHINYLINYFNQMSVKELDFVEVVIMNLWSPYKGVVRRIMPKAKIVVNSFYVVIMINKVLDKKVQVMNSHRHLTADKT